MFNKPTCEAFSVKLSVMTNKRIFNFAVEQRHFLKFKLHKLVKIVYCIQWQDLVNFYKLMLISINLECLY